MVIPISLTFWFEIAQTGQNRETSKLRKTRIFLKVATGFLLDSINQISKMGEINVVDHNFLYKIISILSIIYELVSVPTTILLHLVIDYL